MSYGKLSIKFDFCFLSWDIIRKKKQFLPLFNSRKLFLFDMVN